MSDTTLPEGWLSSTVENLANFIDYRGKTPNKTANGIPLITAKNIRDGYINREPREFIANEDYDGWMTRGIPQIGDVVITTEAPMGNVASINIHEKFALAQRAICLQFYVHDTSKYFELLMRSQYFKNQLNLYATGTTVQGIKAANLKLINLIVPPLAEQKQIAAKLDELLAQVDSLKTRLDAIPKILKRFRQSVLAAAVSGKLTEEWRGSNKNSSAHEQIESIIHERNKKLKKDKPPEKNLLSEIFDIPEEWKWTSLDALASKIVDGTHHTPTYIEQGVPFISVKDIKNGVVNFNSTKFISEQEHAELKKRCFPELGDLLITKSGTIGRTAIVNTNNEFSLFVSVALIKPASPKVNLKYVNIALQKWVNEIDVSSRVVGTAIKNLHLQDMRVLAIPFAPLEEQVEIVRLVDYLLAYADQIEQRVKDAQSCVNHLTQSILAKAFRGELTAEWREQNPDLISGENSAEALLARIQAEREASGKVTKRSRKVV